MKKVFTLLTAAVILTSASFAQQTPKPKPAHDSTTVKHKTVTKTHVHTTTHKAKADSTIKK